MLKKLLKNQKFLSEIKTTLRENKKEILDIFIFGSVSKGKRKPVDIDILILFKERENNEIEYRLRKELEKTTELKIETTSRTYVNLFDAGFLPREFILSEAYSVKLKKSLSGAFGYKSYTLFNLKLIELQPTKRTLFHYALHGRGKSKGIMKDLNGTKISTIILIPTLNSERFVEFLETWELNFKKTPILIPKRTIEYSEI